MDLIFFTKHIKHLIRIKHKLWKYDYNSVTINIPYNFKRNTIYHVFILQLFHNVIVLVGRSANTATLSLAKYALSLSNDLV